MAAVETRMPNMHVQLLSWTPNPELLAASAARLCYRDVSAINIRDGLSAEDVEHLLELVLSSGHLSVVEHISFTFAIDGISRVLSHQLVRHRVGIAFSQQSQRYATVREAGHVTPRTVQQMPMLAEEFESLVAASVDLYGRLLDAGVPNEDARFVLPQAIATRLVMTVNMREMMHIYSIDACLRSQWEMRQLMVRIKREVRSVSPRLAGELKIKCFAQGYCDEARMCSELEGKMPRKDDMFASYERRSKIFYERLAGLVGEEG